MGEFMFQELINKVHEYRVLVLGNTIGVWEEKVNTNEDEFRNNVAIGAKELFFSVKDIPVELSSFAIKAAEVLQVQIAGVDIMIEEHTNKAYIIEVNRGPGLTYDERISPEFKAIASYIEKEANKIEE